MSKKYWTGRVHGIVHYSDSCMVSVSDKCETVSDAEQVAYNRMEDLCLKRNPDQTINHVEICQSDKDAE